MKPLSKTYYRLKTIIKGCCKQDRGDGKNGVVNMSVFDEVIDHYQHGNLTRIEFDGLCRFYNYYSYGDFRQL